MEGIDLFEAIVAEVHSASLQIAAATSAVNAFDRGASDRLMRSFVNYIPRASAVVDEINRCSQELKLPPEIAHCVDRLVQKLKRARSQADLFLIDLNRHGSADAGLRHAAILATMWRELSQLALNAVNSMEPQTRWRLTGLYSENSLVLARLLSAVIHGKCRCLDSRGAIFLPDLPQRRRARRFALLQPCTVYFHGVGYEAFAKDISNTGVGLTDAPPLMLRQHIDIELKSGRRLSGTVVWVKDGKIGVQFVTALSPNDPLLGDQS